MKLTPGKLAGMKAVSDKRGVIAGQQLANLGDFTFAANQE